MTPIQVTTVSSKGQVVIPRSLRKQLGIIDGSKLLVVSDGSNLLLKPIEAPTKQEFMKLIQRSRKMAVTQKIKKSDIQKTIKNLRNAKSRH